jgi:hypothetical protein
LPALRAILDSFLYLLGGIGYAFYLDLNLLETALVVAAILIERRWKHAPEFATRIWRMSFRIAQKPRAAVAFIFVLALAVRAALLPVFPVPHPVITDEFSHLLVADTLAHGRLTNPTHPEWVHFESIHIIQKPTYNSDYFPGQGAVLAVGEQLGHPWIAVWLLSAAMCAALCWMLQAWLPPPWALFCGLLAILRFDIASYWVNGYYGGCLAALGGALAVGAYPRLVRRPALATSLLFGVGIVIIGFTRPFEGLAVAVPAVGALGFAALKKRVKLWTAVPGVVVIAAGFSCLLVYDSAVTGDPLHPPYAVNQATYGWPMTLPWYHPPRVTLRHVELQRYYDYELDVLDREPSVLKRAKSAEELWRFFFGPALSIPLIMLPSVWRRRRSRLLLIIAALTLAMCLIEVGAAPHYAAAATGCFLAISVACFRALCTRRWGAGYAVFAAAIVAAILIARIGLEAFHLPFTQRINYQSWCCVEPGNPAKARILTMLNGVEGRHLVLVKPKTDPDNVFQWIYNDADIDAAKVVWARDLGAQGNETLLRHFHDRIPWELDPNVSPPKIERLSSDEAGSLR